jgi:peptidoglycan hydrolase CwlO-like protein
MASSDLAWKKLVAAQDKIRLQRQEARARLLEAAARLDRLEKQDDLLRKRAGQFIQTDIKDVEELERLEEEEEKQKAEEEAKRAEQEKARKALEEQQQMIAAMLNDPTVGDLDGVDLSSFSFPDQLLPGTLGSYPGNSGS